jgi:hypothetical protein
VFHSEDTVEALGDHVIAYEREARRAAAAKAFSAAITSLGAGLEGLLLLRCLRSKDDAIRIASSLSKDSRPRNLGDPTTWNFEALIETCLAAGWLPPLTTPLAQINSGSLAHALRLMRNYVHPGRQVRERPWLQAGEEEYVDAEAIYTALLSVIVG